MAKARILAVDDQRYFRELLSGMLAAEGFEAETAASGEEALQILDASDFDVVLTDLVMPGMDGTELVHRIRQDDPDQDIVVITGVVDVKTAVDAMKLGATDYLLKPFDKRTLACTIETILQNRRLKTEHARLLSENIEYIGERSLYERALSLFSTLSVETLAMRIADVLCVETRAQGAVVWIVGQDGGRDLDLAGLRGLVRVAEEPETIGVDSLPVALQDETRVALAPWGDGSGEALFASLRRDGEIVGLVRLTDKLEGDAFDPVDEVCVDKFIRFADVAVANALRVRGLERHGLREPASGAYNADYLRSVTRSEIEKANRFGRGFALLKLDLGSPEDLARIGEGEALQQWLHGVCELIDGLLRATDLLGVDHDGRFTMLLPEADALGAAVFKRRALAALSESELLGNLELAARPRPRIGVAVYPGDGAQLESLLGAADERIAEAQRSPVEALGLERLSLAAGLQALARLGEPERPEMAEQLARLALSELSRRPRERGLVYAAPGAALADTLREGLAALRELPLRTEVVVIADGERPDLTAPTVSWVSPRRAPGLPPCLIHYGDGPAYAVVREESHNGAPARLFHTSDRGLVEHLAFRMHEELAVPATLGEDPSS